MEAKQTPDEALNSLYGPVLSQSASIHIYAEGAAFRHTIKLTVRTCLSIPKERDAPLYLMRSTPLTAICSISKDQ
jgi:hypothetical protein